MTAQHDNEAMMKEADAAFFKHKSVDELDAQLADMFAAMPHAAQPGAGPVAATSTPTDDGNALPARTGIVYDERMALHRGPAAHPERPNRIRAIALQLALEPGLLDRCARIAARPASDEELARVHDSSLLTAVQCKHDLSQGGALQFFDEDTYLSEHSADAARLAAGALIEATDACCSGAVRNAFAIVRPPGHHATPDHAMGFCLFDNVAVAVQHAIAARKKNRVLIVDWDVHHGNGIQEAFRARNDVLYVSLHRHPFFPNTGAPDNLGVDAGVGYSVNVAWPAEGFGDADYIAAFEAIVLPLAREFKPDIVFVASGFDAADGDPLGGAHVTPAGYHWMTTALADFQVPLVVALEGGYCLQAIATSAADVVKALLGVPGTAAPLPEPAAVHKETPQILQHLRQLLAPTWHCMRE